MTRRLLLLAAAAVSMTSATFAQSGAYLIDNATVHTLAGETIERGDVVIQNGRIAGVGKGLKAPRGAKTIDARGLHVYPGLFDAFTNLGLTEIGAVRATVDLGEKGDFNPHLQALTAVHPAGEHIPVTRANGVTHALTAPSGGLGSPTRLTISGQVSLIHLDGWTYEEMSIEPSAGTLLSWPHIRVSPPGRRSFGNRPAPPTTFKKAKEDYDKALARLDEWIESVRHYQRAGSSADENPKLQSLLPVIEGTSPLLVVAHSERAIRDAAEFCAKHKFKMILVGGYDAAKVADLLAERDIPVILSPPHRAARNIDDPYDHTYSLASRLHDAGVRFAFATFDSANSRRLPYEAGSTVAYGLPAEEALKAITRYPAEILGVGDRLGTIEEGKIANLIVTDGDPLEITTEIKHVFINGSDVSLDNKHRRLYEKYLARP